jgi:hypothetical protein
MSSEDIKELAKTINSHRILKHEEGSWCDLAEDEETVIFYQKDGSPFLFMSLETFEQLKKWKENNGNNSRFPEKATSSSRPRK